MTGTGGGGGMSVGWVGFLGLIKSRRGKRRTQCIRMRNCRYKKAFEGCQFVKYS